jgi:hypothetical protein
VLLLILSSFMNDLLDHFLRTVHRDYFMGFPLGRLHDGRIAGEFLKVRLESRFRPVHHEQGTLLGQAAELVATAPDGTNIGQHALARLTQVSESPVVLDRFIRCLHLLNYLLGGVHEGALFLPVSAALLDRVNRDHGMVFRQILDQLTPATVHFLLPGTDAVAPPTLPLLRDNYARYSFQAFLPLNQTSQGAVVVRSLSEHLTHAYAQAR